MLSEQAIYHLHWDGVWVVIAVLRIIVKEGRYIKLRHSGLYAWDASDDRPSWRITQPESKLILTCSMFPNCVHSRCSTVLRTLIYSLCR